MTTGARDVSTYDWRHWYSDRARWPVTTEIFLADAVCRLGTMMVFPFSDQMIADATLPPAPELPGAHEAFDDTGRPDEGIHEAFGAAVLAQTPAVGFFSGVLRAHDRQAWLRAHTPDPETGMPRFDVEKAGLASDRITREHWDEAALDASYANDARAAAAKALPHVARALARLAADGDIQTFARPIDGRGEDVALDPSDWEIGDPLARIASCGIDIAARRATEPPATHLLFVREKGFDTAGWIISRMNPLSLIDEGIEPGDVGIIGPKPSAVNAKVKEMAYGVLKRHLVANPGDYTRPKLRAVLDAAGHSRIGEKMFEEIRGRLRDEFPFMRDPGAPPGGDRRETAGRSRKTDPRGSNVIPITPLIGTRRDTSDPH